MSQDMGREWDDLTIQDWLSRKEDPVKADPTEEFTMAVEEALEYWEHAGCDPEGCPAATKHKAEALASIQAAAAELVEGLVNKPGGDHDTCYYDALKLVAKLREGL